MNLYARRTGDLGTNLAKQQRILRRTRLLFYKFLFVICVKEYTTAFWLLCRHLRPSEHSRWAAERFHSLRANILREKVQSSSALCVFCGLVLLEGTPQGTHRGYPAWRLRNSVMTVEPCWSESTAYSKCTNSAPEISLWAKEDWSNFISSFVGLNTVEDVTSDSLVLSDSSARYFYSFGWESPSMVAHRGRHKIEQDCAFLWFHMSPVVIAGLPEE